MGTLIDSLWHTSWTTWRRSLSCKRFALLYTALEREALEQGDSFAWMTKPKLHLLQELLEYTALEVGSHLDTGRIWMSHGEVGWPQQGPGEEEPTTLPKSH